jgi:hypothetical protein
VSAYSQFGLPSGPMPSSYWAGTLNATPGREAEAMERRTQGMYTLRPYTPPCSCHSNPFRPGLPGGWW